MAGSDTPPPPASGTPASDGPPPPRLIPPDWSIGPQPTASTAAQTLARKNRTVTTLRPPGHNGPASRPVVRRPSSLPQYPPPEAANANGTHPRFRRAAHARVGTYRERRRRRAQGAARSHPHAGEPLVRQFLRRIAVRAGQPLPRSGRPLPRKRSLLHRRPLLPSRRLRRAALREPQPRPGQRVRARFPPREPMREAGPRPFLGRHAPGNELLRAEPDAARSS